MDLSIWKTTISFINKLIIWKKISSFIFISKNNYLFSRTIYFFITKGFCFIQQASWQASHFVNVQFGGDLKLWRIVGKITIITPSLSVDLFYLVLFWIRCIHITSFQCQSIRYFFVQVSSRFHQTLNMDRIFESIVQILLPPVRCVSS